MLTNIHKFKEEEEARPISFQHSDLGCLARQL